MKKLKYLYCVLLLVIVCFSFSACEAEPYEEEKVTPTASISDSTVISDASSYYWTYTAEKTDGRHSTGAGTDVKANVVNEVWQKGLPTEFGQFSVGTWDFTFKAYATTAADTPYATGTASVTFTAGEAGTISITMDSTKQQLVYSGSDSTSTSLYIDVYESSNNSRYIKDTLTVTLANFKYNTTGEEAQDVTYVRASDGITVTTSDDSLIISTTTDGYLTFSYGTGTISIPVNTNPIAVHELSFRSASDLTNANVFPFIGNENYIYSYSPTAGEVISTTEIDFINGWAKENFMVYVDGNLTTYEPYSITATAGQVISILLLKSSATFFPVPDLSCYDETQGKSIINTSEILQPFPALSWLPNTNQESMLWKTSEASSSTERTLFYVTFRGCKELTTIPADLFKYNTGTRELYGTFWDSGLTEIPSDLFSILPNMWFFTGTFRGCTGIESIPEGLFNNNLNAQWFRHTFRACTNLTYVPNDLYLYNTKVTRIASSFRGDSMASIDMTIGSSIITEVDYFATDVVDAKVSVPADSTTYDTFMASSSTDTPANVTVTPYSPESTVQLLSARSISTAYPSGGILTPSEML